jgi:hypothetical protein
MATVIILSHKAQNSLTANGHHAMATYIVYYKDRYTVLQSSLCSKYQISIVSNKLTDCTAVASADKYSHFSCTACFHTTIDLQDKAVSITRVHVGYNAIEIKKMK